MDPRLIVVRDQFALRNLSDEALRRIAPTLIKAQKAIFEEIKAALGPGDRPELSWYLTRRKESLAIIDRQLLEVAARLDDLLPDDMAAAYRQGAANAQQYLDAVTPDTELQQQELLTRTGPEPRPYVTPAITEEQLRAVVRGPGFRSLPGLLDDAAGLGEQSIAYRWAGANAQALRQRLEGGFLLSKSNSEILADVRGYMEGASRAQMEAIVRTSMATASQSAHDAFYAANEDALGDADGNRYRWDASNDGRLCPKCAPLDDTRYKTREAVPQHPAHYNCRCKILPITPLSDELSPLQGSFLESTPASEPVLDKDGNVVTMIRNGKRVPKMRRLDRPPGWQRNTAQLTAAERAEGYQVVAQTAYARPRRIGAKTMTDKDGNSVQVPNMVYQRRRELKSGRPTAGAMLAQSNLETAKEVLGSERAVKWFDYLLSQKRFRNDPQGVLIEMLRPDGGRKNEYKDKPPGSKRWERRMERI